MVPDKKCYLYSTNQKMFCGKPNPQSSCTLGKYSPLSPDYLVE